MRPLLRIGMLALTCGIALVLGASAAVGRGLESAPRKLQASAVVSNPAPIVFQRKVTPPRPVLRARRAALVARRYLGVPYRWGGMSPAGFDCSGLVAFAYGRVGVQLPHNAAAQWRYGRPVPIGRLRPGDLVFFSGLGHVGIAVGAGRFIHSPQSGEVVRIERLARRAGSIVGARRLW